MTDMQITLTCDERLDLEIALNAAILRAEESAGYWAEIAEQSGKDGSREYPHAAGNVEYYRHQISSLGSVLKKLEGKHE